MEELISIQSELNAPKSRKNSFGNYNYRSCEDILEAVKPLLKKHECFLTLSDSIEAVGNRVYVKATATLTKGTTSITVTAFAREEETKKGMDSSQITGAASSYARKYALNGLFAIDDEKDSDATNTHGKQDERLSKKVNAYADSFQGVKKASELPAKPEMTEVQKDNLIKRILAGEDVYAKAKEAFTIPAKYREEIESFINQ